MSEWQAITAKIKREDALRELDHAGCEAIIDALALVMYADDEASFLELSELELLLHALPWALSAPGEVERYTEQAVRRAQSLQGAQARHAQVSDIADRLRSARARKQTLAMAAAMAQANFHTSVAERALLMALADAFELPRPIASAILSDAAGEHGAQEASRLPTRVTQQVARALGGDFLESFFGELFQDDDLLHLSAPERLAFVDALTLALVADGEPEREELEEFKAQLERLPFSSEDAQTLRARVEATLEALRAMSAAEHHALMADVARRLSSQPLRMQALRMAARVTHADFAITPQERGFLHALAGAFEVSGAQLDALVDEVREAHHDDFLV